MSSRITNHELLGLGLAIVFLFGCSGSEQVSEQAAPDASSDRTKPSGRMSTPDDKEEDVLPFLKNKKKAAPETEGSETKTGEEATESNTDQKLPGLDESNTDTDVEDSDESNVEADSGDDTDEVEDSTAGKTSAKRSAGRTRKLGPPAEPSGNVGTDPGDTLPEISGTDVDGVDFALSDYEGKVKMVDFWGDW